MLRAGAGGPGRPLPGSFISHHCTCPPVHRVVSQETGRSPGSMPASALTSVSCLICALGFECHRALPASVSASHSSSHERRPQPVTSIHPTAAHHALVRVPNHGHPSPSRSAEPSLFSPAAISAFARRGLAHGQRRTKGGPSTSRARFTCNLIAAASKPARCAAIATSRW